jgi:hypothetical protein
MVLESPKAGSGLQTRHVFLDTDVYRRYGHNLHDKVLQRLLQLTKDHICILHITDITMAEIERQLRDLAAEVALAVNKGNRLLRNWHSVRSQRFGNRPSTPVDVDASDLANEALSGFGSFGFLMHHEFKAITHIALDVPPKAIFDSYFQRKPPFDKQNSKEFPDAFVVAALNSWCLQKSEKIYFITKDKAMLRAASQTKALLPISTLEDFLALLADDPQAIKKVMRILESSTWDTVEERVRDEIAHLGTVYTGDLHDGEVVDHRPSDGPIELIDFDVISASDDQIEVVAKLKAPIEFDVQFLDTSSAWWDSEDKEYIGGDTETETLELDTTLSVFLVIDQEDESVKEVKLLTRDVNVEEPYETYK